MPILIATLLSCEYVLQYDVEAREGWTRETHWPELTADKDSRVRLSD
jgi:hypothetical protein